MLMKLANVILLLVLILSSCNPKAIQVDNEKTSNCNRSDFIISYMINDLLIYSSSTGIYESIFRDTTFSYSHDVMGIGYLKEGDFSEEKTIIENNIGSDLIFYDDLLACGSGHHDFQIRHQPITREENEMEAEELLRTKKYRLIVYISDIYKSKDRYHVFVKVFQNNYDYGFELKRYCTAAFEYKVCVSNESIIFLNKKALFRNNGYLKLDFDYLDCPEFYDRI